MSPPPKKQTSALQQHVDGTRQGWTSGVALPSPSPVSLPAWCTFPFQCPHDCGGVAQPRGLPTPRSTCSERMLKKQGNTLAPWCTTPPPKTVLVPPPNRLGAPPHPRKKPSWCPTPKKTVLARTSLGSARMMVSVVMSRATRVPLVSLALSTLLRQPTT